MRSVSFCHQQDSKSLSKERIGLLVQVTYSQSYACKRAHPCQEVIFKFRAVRRNGLGYLSKKPYKEWESFVEIFRVFTTTTQVRPFAVGTKFNPLRQLHNETKYYVTE